MIQYGLSARPALARLMRSYNDIDIYVEDSTYVGVYKKLVNKALAGRGSVASVTPLGPKSVVLARAMNDNAPGGRPRLYIVDGDFDFISKKRHPSAPHLYRLNVYSLENLVFERAGVYALSELSLPDIEDNRAHQLSGYEQIERCLDNDLAYLFKIHAIARRMGVNDRSFRIESFSISDTYNGRVISANRQKCRRKAIQLISELKRRKGLSRYRLARAVVNEIIQTRAVSGSAYVPGKEFHLKYLVGKLGQAGGASLAQNVVVAALADKCTFSRDPRLVRRLRKLAKAAVSTA